MSNNEFYIEREKYLLNKLYLHKNHLEVNKYILQPDKLNKKVNCNLKKQCLESGSNGLDPQHLTLAP